MEGIFLRYSIYVLMELDIRFSWYVVHLIVLKAKAIDDALNKCWLIHLDWLLILLHNQLSACKYFTWEAATNAKCSRTCNVKYGLLGKGFRNLWMSPYF